MRILYVSSCILGQRQHTGTVQPSSHAATARLQANQRHCGSAAGKRLCRYSSAYCMCDDADRTIEILHYVLCMRLTAWDRLAACMAHNHVDRDYANLLVSVDLLPLLLINTQMGQRTWISSSSWLLLSNHSAAKRFTCVQNLVSQDFRNLLDSIRFGSLTRQDCYSTYTCYSSSLCIKRR